MLRAILWRAAALVAALLAVRFLADILQGSIGRALRARSTLAHSRAPRLPSTPGGLGGIVPGWLGTALSATAATVVAVALALLAVRVRARRRRRYIRLRLLPYRTDHAGPEALTRMYATLHAALAERWWRRLLCGQPSTALEAWLDESGRASLALSCPPLRAAAVRAALQSAYPNLRVLEEALWAEPPPVLVRLKKHAGFIRRTATPGRFDREAQPAMDGVLRAMAAGGTPALVQLALTPAPGAVERLARGLFRHREREVALDRSLLDQAELLGGLEVQHRALFFADVRVLATSREGAERISGALRARRAENRLVERGAPVRQGRLGLFRRRLQRGEGNPVPGLSREVFSPGELAELWQLPGVDFTAVPLARGSLPLAPAPPEVCRAGEGTLRDALGPVSIHEELRRQNVAVPGTVDQGKSSFLVASVAEDLRRERCAVIVLDPKGDAAEAALSVVPPGRTCTLLDFADPTCGFNPLRVDAPADVIADYVVGALKGLFTDADIRASSDRYLRNAVIAVLAHDPASTLWDAARMLSVGEEGYAYRRAVGTAVRSLPELKEISAFFTAELTAQLADARSATTAKLDAPVNKLARLLNSPSIKRVLLNESLRVDFDRVIGGAEMLVVKGALGSMGAGNTSVLMQLLVGMLDAALARQQDLVPAAERIAVALKVDEAPLVLNRGFAETIALKRSAGLETVACWQTDAQWTEREVRDQLDALFAHRVCFATASAEDARASAKLAMAEFSDSVRPGIERLSTLGRPDVRLRLPRHHAVVSWVTPAGRAPAFVAETLPMRVDRARINELAAEQAARGARRLTDLRQRHWEGEGRGGSGGSDKAGGSGAGGHGPRRALLSPAASRTAKPSTAAESYRELLDLDRARSARPVARRGRPGPVELDESDVGLLTLLASFDHLLTSQIHRRLAPRRAATTTQRRVKRLADGGLIDRLQFHRRDGGGVPMCCALAPAGIAALEALGVEVTAGSPQSPPGDVLQRVRHELHVAGWALALAAAYEGASARGRAGSVIAPPRGPARPFSPADLRLPGGRVPHDFLKGGAELDRFETLRPDATVTVCLPGEGHVDLLVERDDRVGRPAWIAKLERWDHFLAGWSLHTARYRRAARPLAVFLCRDEATARESARRADHVLRACQAYAGDYAHHWSYDGRQSLVFLAERGAHEGDLTGFAVPALPPDVRAALADEDSAGEARAVAVRLPGT